MDCRLRHHKTQKQSHLGSWHGSWNRRYHQKNPDVPRETLKGQKVDSRADDRYWEKWERYEND